MYVHQFHPTVSYGDAVGNQVLSLQRLLRGMGHRSQAFCERAPLASEGRAREITRYPRASSSDGILLLHYSLGYSAHILDWLSQVPDRKVLVYHNITPHEYFAGVNQAYFEAAQRGREQLDALRQMADVAWGDSAYNCEELLARGWEYVEVLPIVFDPRRYRVRPDRDVLRNRQDGFNVLFVGRVSPNKRFEDLILTFHYLKRWVRPDARLTLVGSAQGMEPYLDFLQALIRKLGLSDVVFTGHVSKAALVAHFRSAHVFLSMSEHEGFGVPLLESMCFGVPIIAYRAAAVPETLGDSGVLVRSKDYAAIAELIGVVAEDAELRARIVARQTARLQAFLPDRVAERLKELLGSLDE